MIAAILKLLGDFFASIPYFDKWFSKSTTSKVIKRKKKLRKKADSFRKTGRPKWK